MPVVASAMALLKISSVFSNTGVDRVLGWRSPNYVYSCHVTKVLMRNIPLSDDITSRFASREWLEHPLTADKYASWIAASPGDYVNVFINYETFGKHQNSGTGIMDFLRWLPRECSSRGVEFATPTEIAYLPAAEELNVEETISWAEADKDNSAWQGNLIQDIALREVQAARAFASDLDTWRRLQTSDHFCYMASKFGVCDEVHTCYSPNRYPNAKVFDGYMRILSDFEARSARAMRPQEAAMALRCLQPDKAFHFHSPSAAYTVFTSYSMDGFGEMLNFAPSDSVAYHLVRGDFAQWIRDALRD
jgi:alpha-amylase